jgi:glycosyltransferase involved in cell wall biosynthesis
MTHSNHKERLKIFTWHIHGSYLYYLSQGDYDIYIPVKEPVSPGYYGRGKTFPFDNNVIEVPVERISELKFDCILFQTDENYLVDQFDILTQEQRELPCIYLEHDPPWDDPTETKHIFTNDEGILVHVTNFNRLMWQNRVNNVKVIEHGVVNHHVAYTGEIAKGLVVVNHLHQRGRKLGADIFEQVSKEVPLELIGMGTKEYGGLGEVLHPQLPSFMPRYRFFFNPIRYTSFGLSVCEAMMAGMPIVALATTEYVTVIKDGTSGFISTDMEYLIDRMKLLVERPSLATEMGMEAKAVALKRFDINRFVLQWKETFQQAIRLKSRTYERTNSIHQ